jgi:hypothetical protein
MCVTNFVFLQFIGCGKWYYGLHYSNDIENDFDCLMGTIAKPEGNRIDFSCRAFVIR